MLTTTDSCCGEGTVTWAGSGGGPPKTNRRRAAKAAAPPRTFISPPRSVGLLCGVPGPFPGSYLASGGGYCFAVSLSSVLLVEVEGMVMPAAGTSMDISVVDSDVALM